MDFAKYLDCNKYVMSLDSIDIALLSKYSSRFTKPPVPLWTANSLSSNEYFEFEVKSKTVEMLNEDSGSDYDTANLSDLNQSRSTMSDKDDGVVTTCHICSLDLPVAYLGEHESSLKHKAYLKIADAVLERARKHMLRKVNTFAEKVEKYNRMYFCESCVIEVELADRKRHEKSKGHKQALALDRVLYELAGLYTDDENCNELNVNNKVDYNGNVKTEVNKDGIAVNELVVISDMKASLDEFETQKIENYIKLIDEFNADKLYVLTSIGADVKITMDDVEVIVAEDHFHGFKKVKDNFAFCIVCNMVVGDKETHKISDGHIKNIATPFKDHNFIRNLEFGSHCVICNKLVNYGLHTRYTTHIELLEKALVVKKSKQNKREKVVVSKDKSEEVTKDSVIENKQPKGLNNLVEEKKNLEAKNLDNHEQIPSNYENGADNKDINTNASRLLKSITVNEDKINKPSTSTAVTKLTDNGMYLCKPCNIEIHVNNIESHVNGGKHSFNSKSDVHYIMKDVGSVTLLCRACNVYVDDDVNAIKAHVVTNDHINKYYALLSDNHLMKQNDNFFCVPCDVVVPKINELYHIEKLVHENKLAVYKELKVQVNATTNAIAEEIVSDNSKAGGEVLYYFCDVCNVKIPNNTYNINTHNDGARHKKNAKAVNATDSIETNSLVSENNESSDAHYQMEATDNEKTLMCRVCKVPIPNIVDNITEHVAGKKHDATLKSLMDANGITLKVKSYFCKNCNKYFTKRSLFKHIDDERHRIASDRNLQSDVTEPLQVTAFKEDIVNADNKETDNGDHKHPLNEMNVDDMTVSRTDNLIGCNNLMTEDFIIQIDNGGYFCAICTCLVPLKGDVDHVKGARHIGNYAQAISKVICDVCKFNVTDMASHIKSDVHLIRIIKNQPTIHICEYCKLLMLECKADEHVNTCHRLAVKDKICFCTTCDPYLPKLKGK